MASSESGSGGSSGGSRIRSVELMRRCGSKLGFSVRGGREHATGFFVTAVEPHSEAHSQGLKVGDQIIRVNGFPVEDATHCELLQLIQAHTNLLLKVRGVGMIPEKEESSGELRWRIVDSAESMLTLDPEQLARHNELAEQLARHNELAEQLVRQSEVPLVLKVPSKAKLGCGICKGPVWKPGIFVQFTKENSIARAGGLRPGDQILECNNILFTPDMPFNEAVSIMRSCGLLKLVVRKGAGLELFPGESSGYNSSASSVAGDHPTSSWTNTSPEPVRLGDEGEADRRFDCMEPGGGLQNQHGGNNIPGSNSVIQETSSGGSTIVQVGPDSQCLPNTKVAEICMVSQQTETKTTTVLVEVHHSEKDNSDESLHRTNSSVSSNTSSLRRAISQELERRSKRAAAPPTEKLIKTGLTKEEMHQHEQLMHEFRQAHMKMFSTQPDKAREEEVSSNEKTQTRAVTKVDGASRAEGRNKSRDDSLRPRHKKQPAPPPPPPMPCGEDSRPRKGQAPPPPNRLPPQCQPAAPESPPCPTPDYDTLSIASDCHQFNDKVDMQSLESFRLTNPTATVQKPKPPNTYFPKTSSSSSLSGSTVILKDNRPLVTIREYGDSARSIQSTVPISGDKLSQTMSRSSGHNHNQVSKYNNVINGTDTKTGGSVIKISVENGKHNSNGNKPAPFFLFPECRRAQQGNSPLCLTERQVQPQPNGILKNSNISQVQIHSAHLDKPLPIKSIKFGAITTVIRDSPEPKA